MHSLMKPEHAVQVDFDYLNSLNIILFSCYVDKTILKDVVLLDVLELD